MTSLPGYMWSEEEINGTRMGQYITNLEWAFIKEAFTKFGVPSRVLDIGGGDGRMAWRMRSVSCQVVLLEYDYAPLLRLKVNRNTDLFLRGNGLQLPIKENSFNCVLAIQVSVCVSIENMARFFTEVHHVLKPGGMLLFTTGNASSPLGYLFHASRKQQRFYGMTYQYYSSLYGDVLDKLRFHGFRSEFQRGYRWLPFGRASQNRRVGLAGHVEKMLGLRYIPSLSPWIFWAARKDRELK